jgi:hypothetical protein
MTHGREVYRSGRRGRVAVAGGGGATMAR